MNYYNFMDWFDSNVENTIDYWTRFIIDRLIAYWQDYTIAFSCFLILILIVIVGLYYFKKSFDKLNNKLKEIDKIIAEGENE